MKSERTHVRCYKSAAILFALLAAWSGAAIERAVWQQRVEADWLLAEEVAAQDQLGGLVTTKADAATETLAQLAAR